MSNSRNTGFLTNVIKVDATGNVSFVSGSTTLATISTSGQMSGSLPALSSSYALSASYVTNAETLDGLDSTVFTLTSSFNTTSASLYTVSSSAYATSGSLSATSGSLSATSGSLSATSGSLSATSGSFNTRVTALEVTGSALSSSILSVSASSYSTSGSLSSASGSFNTRISTVESKYATTGSNTFRAPQYVTDTTVPSGFANSTGSIYTDGGLLVAKDSYFSGSMFIKGNLTIYGTQSVAYITSSQLNIATNVITVNTATPSVRFGGLNVYDSGSTGTGATGSLFWDSQNNGWVYQRESGSTYSGGMLISGPRRGSGTNLGDEQGTTACMVMVGQGGDHITSSLIYHDSSVTCIPGAIVGGTMSGTTIYGSTAVCSPVGKFTTCIDAGSVTATSFNLGNGQYLRLTRNSGALQYDAFGIVAGTDNTRIISTNDFDIVNGGLVSQFKIAGSGAATFACGVGICGSLDIIGNTTSQTFNTRSGTGFNSFQMGADTSAGGFYVYDNTNGVYRFTIKNSGIATFACQVCAPSAVFSKAADQVIRVETTSATDNSRIDFITPSKCYTIQNLQTGAANALIFYDLSASTERMRITSDGRVGINVSPAASTILHVQDNAARSAVYRLEPYTNAYESKLIISSRSSGDGGIRYGCGGGNDMNIFSYSTMRFNVGSGNIGGNVTCERLSINSDGIATFACTIYAPNIQVTGQIARIDTIYLGGGLNGTGNATAACYQIESAYALASNRTSVFKGPTYAGSSYYVLMYAAQDVYVYYKLALIQSSYFCGYTRFVNSQDGSNRTGISQYSFDNGGTWTTLGTTTFGPGYGYASGGVSTPSGNYTGVVVFRAALTSGSGGSLVGIDQLYFMSCGYGMHFINTLG